MEYSERKKRKIGYIVAIAVLTAAAVTMSVLFAVAKKGQTDAEREFRTLAEGTYSKSYYALLYNMDGLDTAADKLSVASGKATRQEYLADISSYATAAAENMSAFTPEDTGEPKMLKFINQTGDYAKYLDDKLNKGGNLTEKDRETLEEIARSVREIKASLATLGEEVERGDFSFVDAIKEKDSRFSETLSAFDSKDVDYPSMIYDGPFSDGLTDRQAKALSGEKINETRAKEIAAKLLHLESADISVKEGSKNVFESYDCKAETAEGTAYLTLAKQGGFPVSLNLPNAHSEGVNVDTTVAERKAEEYLRALGIPAMKAVWASLYENVYYINLAAYEDGVILYPDLVKVKVAADDGRVVGMESLNYIYNHTSRTLPAAVVTEREAAEAVGEYIEVSSCRLALVPTKGGGEALTYEFYGTKGGEDKYFVYVDAESGEELKIMRVLDGERGLLLQ